ncbi:lycopene biosynthesis protein [Escherichia coli]|nr:lycopene biosynthesis protein [Escherichia coli]
MTESAEKNFPAYSHLPKDKEYPITIYNIAPFNKDLWSLLKSSQECPPGESKITNKCLHNSCIIKICPYGLK